MQTVKDNTNAGAGTQVCAGGFIFGFADEWYKAGNPNNHLAGPDFSFKGTLFAGGYFDEGWFGLTQAIFEELGADPARVLPTTTDAFPRPAPRPAYSVLSDEAWRRAGLAPMRPWRAALHAAFAASGDALRP